MATDQGLGPPRHRVPVPEPAVRTAAIRRATGDDAGQLTALMHASTAYRGRFASILDGYAVTPDQVARDLVFVATLDAAIAGFYSLVRLPKPELDLLFVADEAQGHGIGRLLFGHMRTEAARLGVRAVRIVSHPPSVQFYQRMGAEVVGSSAPTKRVEWARPILRLDV